MPPLFHFSSISQAVGRAMPVATCPHHALQTLLQNVLRFLLCPRCHSNRPLLAGAVSPQTTAAKSRSRSTTSPQKLQQLAAGLSPSPPSLGKGTQARNICRAGQRQEQPGEEAPGEQQAEGQQQPGSATGGGEPACSRQQAADALQAEQQAQQAAGCGQASSQAAANRAADGAAAAAGLEAPSGVPVAAVEAAVAAEQATEVQPAPAADEPAGCDIPATQLILPGTLPATARVTQLPATAQGTQLLATAPVRASLAAAADLPAIRKADASARARYWPPCLR